MPGDHVRHDVAGGGGQQGFGRARLQRQDQADAFADLFRVQVQARGQRVLVVRGQQFQRFVEDAGGDVAGRHAAGLGGQLHPQAFAQVARGQAGAFAVQDALADGFGRGGGDGEALGGLGGQRVGVGGQVAGLVGVFQPECGHGQRGRVQFQRQRLQRAQLRVGAAGVFQPLQAVVVAFLPAAAVHVPHRGFRQFVEGGGFQRGAGGVALFAGGGGLLFQLQQRIGVQRAADFHFQLQAVQLQQPD